MALKQYLSRRPEASRRGWMAGGCVWLSLLATGAQAATALPSPRGPPTRLGVVTNIAQLREANLSGQRGAVTLDLQAEVLTYNRRSAYLFLRDRTGFMRLDTGFRDLEPPKGRVRFQAPCWIGLDQWPLIQGRVLEQSDASARREASGSVFLDKGLHSVRLLYWQRAGQPALRLLYEGPGVSKEPLPEGVLFRPASSNITAGTMVSGLEYELFEGLPRDLSRIHRNVTAGRGTRSTFDLSGLDRTNAFTVEFNGFLSVAERGAYTFSAAGGGNCLFFVDEDRLKITGPGPPLPEATNQVDLSLEIGTAIELRDLIAMDYEGSCRASLDGVVCHVNPADGLLVLRDESGAVPLRFPPGAGLWNQDQHLILHGELHLRAGQVFANQILLLDADNPSGAREIGRTSNLRAGLNPFYLDCLFGSSNLDVAVSLEGPGVPRHSISEQLMRRPQEATQEGAVAPAPGAACAVYGGDWSWLPELGGLHPAFEGWTPQLRVPAGSPAEAGAIRFSGALSVPAEGIFHFRIKSSRPSRFYLLKSDLESAVAESQPPWPPRQITPGAGLTPVDYDQWSVAEGRVRFVSESFRAVRLELSSEQGSLEVHLLNRRLEDLLPLNNCRVRVSGIVTRLFNGAGPWGGILEVPDLTLVEPQELPDWVWETPLAPAGASDRTNRASARGSLVRVQGVWMPGARPGEGVLSNSAGSVALQSGFPFLHRAGVPLQAVGRLVDGANPPRLMPVFGREEMSESSTNTSDFLPTLTTLEQVHQLSASEAARRYPAHARGILVSGPPYPVLQDATRGIFIGNWTNFVSASIVGDCYEVEGYSDPGGFSPILRLTAARHLGAGQLPNPRRPTLAQLRTGSEDAQWTELAGVIQSASNNVWRVALQDGSLRVRVGGATPSWCAALQGAVVRLQGIPLPVHNSQRQLLEVFLHLPGPQCVCIERPPLADPFDLPRSRPGDLLRFNPQGLLSQGVHLRGVVAYCGPNLFCLLDGDQAIKCAPEEPLRLDAGEEVEVVGFPEPGVYAPALRQTKVKRLGRGQLPPAPVCTLEDLVGGRFDGVRVRVRAQLSSSHLEGDDAILNLQMGSRLVAARLPAKRAGDRVWEPGSRLEVAATCNGLERDATGDGQGRRLRAFELLIDSAQDVRVTARPPWWNSRHTSVVLGGTGVVLMLAAAWIGLLRRQVAAQTRGLREEIETRKATEERLNREVEERTRAQQEVERVHQELMLASRLAGMAEVATGVLHNVGNVLNSINVSASCVSDKLKHSRVRGVHRLSELLREHKDRLAEFMAREDRGRKLPAFVEALSRSLAVEQQEVLKELAGLRLNVDHVREIVAMQQTYARVGGVVERVEAAGLIQDALVINEASFQRHGIRVRREISTAATLWIDRHKLLQILVNLLSNAKRACLEAGGPGHEVILRLRGGAGSLCFDVADDGVGIAPENLTRIFVHGFTTRKNGHGFGLHNSALAAKELGGSLTVRSAGPGQGATFTLEVPLQAPAKETAPPE